MAHYSCSENSGPLQDYTINGTNNKQQENKHTKNHIQQITKANKQSTRNQEKKLQLTNSPTTLRV